MSIRPMARPWFKLDGVSEHARDRAWVEYKPSREGTYIVSYAMFARLFEQVGA